MSHKSEHKPEWEVELLLEAQFDIERIALQHRGYVGVESARKITDSIYSKLEYLKQFPGIGFEIPDRALSRQDYRGFVLDSRYLCIYRVIANKIYIYHIADTRTDYQRLFKYLPK